MMKNSFVNYELIRHISCFIAQYHTYGYLTNRNDTNKYTFSISNLDTSNKVRWHVIIYIENIAVIQRHTFLRGPLSVVT